MSNTTTQRKPHIAIVGGGPAGLVLLLTLYRRGVAATLYERDEGFDSRAHLGGTLDLRWKSGQRALRENGLQELFNELSRPEGEEFKICDASGKVVFALDPNESQGNYARPEIDRSVLRKLLLDACPAESIKWGHALVSAEPLSDGQHKLTFTNGVSTICDILVGADGAHSRIRPLLSPSTPIYTGITGAEISLPPDVVASPEMADVREFVGQGTRNGLQDSKMLAAQMNGDGRIRMYAWFRGPEDWVLPREPHEARRALLEVFGSWNPTFTKIIEHCDPAAIYHRPLYALPVGHSWQHVPGITLIGDAAHLMSPYGGAGANLAMLDGLNLGLVLSEAVHAGQSVAERETALKAWEVEMFATCGRYATLVERNLKAFMNPGAPGTAVEIFEDMPQTGGDTSDSGAQIMQASS